MLSAVDKQPSGRWHVWTTGHPCIQSMRVMGYQLRKRYGRVRGGAYANMRSEMH